MSYVAELTHTARAMTRLAVAGNDGLTVGELDIVLAARRALLNVLSTVLVDVTTLEPLAHEWRTFERLALHPVSALPTALARYPTPPPAEGPSTTFQLEPTSKPGRAWRDVARHATLAHHHWTTGRPADIDDTGAWTAVADIAAMASLLSDVDLDLLRVTRAWDARRPDLLALEAGLSTGLGVIAREAMRLAAAGPLHETSPDRARGAPPPGVMRVAEPDELVSAIQQIGVLLRDAPHVRPEHVRLVAIAHIRVCRTVADAFDHGSGAQRAAGGRLREHAARLAEAVERPWPISSMGRGDKRAFHQADDAQRAVRRWLPEDLTAHVDPAQLLPALGDTTRQLAATADRHLRRGQWLTPISEPAPRRARLQELWFGYEPHRPGSPVPRQVSRLQAAVDHAFALLADGLPDRSTRAANPAPVVTVNAAGTAEATADPAAPRPPPPANHSTLGMPADMPWRDVAGQRQSVRPRAPRIPPMTRRPKRR
jgi:hypothetical protein